MENIAYKPSQVANYFLSKGNEENREITMLKLVKLTYIAHGWNLALTSKPLINEEIQAWQYGPVVPSIYHEFKRFNRQPITELALEFDFETLKVKPSRIPRGDHETKAILDKVWNVYKTITGYRLIDITHADGSPWKKHYRDGEKGIIIPNEDIQKHYTQILQQLVA